MFFRRPILAASSAAFSMVIHLAGYGTERRFRPTPANFRLADDTEVHHPKPTSRRTGISAVAGPTALTLVDFVQSIPIPIPSHPLAQPTKIPSYMGVQAGYNRFQLAS